MVLRHPSSPLDRFLLPYLITRTYNPLLKQNRRKLLRFYTGGPSGEAAKRSGSRPPGCVQHSAVSCGSCCPQLQKREQMQWIIRQGKHFFFWLQHHYNKKKKQISARRHPPTDDGLRSELLSTRRRLAVATNILESARKLGRSTASKRRLQERKREMVW
jgi:hypothetical protein